MKLCDHLNAARRGSRLHGKRLLKQKRARAWTEPKVKQVPLVPLSELWPHMSRRERIGANLAMAGVPRAVLAAAAAKDGVIG